MRFTEKIKDGYILNDNATDYPFDMRDKFGQYEDNDQKLGIDYNTITQALLKGIHYVDFKNGEPIIRHIDGLCLRAYNCRTFLLSSGMNNFFMKSYGKLWALTKEELL